MLGLQLARGPPCSVKLQVDLQIQISWVSSQVLSVALPGNKPSTC